MRLHFVSQEHFRDAVEMDKCVCSVRARAASGLFVDGFGGHDDLYF